MLEKNKFARVAMAPWIFAMTLLWLAGSTAACAATWEYQGNTAGDMACFYDKDSLVRPSANLVLVWTKCISQVKIDKALEQADPSLRSHLTESLKKRLLIKDLPGFVEIPTVKRTLKPYSTDPGAAEWQATLIQVETEEYLANNGHLKENSTARQEFDCANRTARLLALTLYNETGATKSSRTSMKTEPGNIAPDSPAEWLLALVCPVR